MLKASPKPQSSRSLQLTTPIHAVSLCRRLGRVMLCCSILAASPCHGDALYFDTELSYVHEDNVAHAARASATVDDDVMLARASANWLQPTSPRGGLLVSLAGEYQAYAHWSALSRATVSGQLSYRYKPSTDFNAPWLEVSASGALHQFRDSAMRDGGRVGFEAATGSALTDRLNLRLAYRFAIDRSWHDTVFDSEVHRVYGNVDWHIGRMTCYTTLGWQRGDAVSSVIENVELDAAARAQASDPALSDEQHSRIAYRLDADTLSATLGFNVALASRLALDVSALYFDADSETRAHYRGYRVTAGVLYRF